MRDILNVHTQQSKQKRLSICYNSVIITFDDTPVQIINILTQLTIEIILKVYLIKKIKHQKRL